ncbi:lanosterol 14-alpha demethylase [Streptomyces minutiscleroticus]|uniref:Lanosterol 14-alpha demethylase n=1 Tax=Streptomyces minutiscleroticus TaxID=68238 RepID=A0A918NZX5_9ACTN|nr:cytochrome P450 [Streptomyces minutiscleroticus]GGY08984.1 lanosterol 14-alpha demethylase [Streptomyces minutiscleroticus]
MPITPIRGTDRGSDPAAAVPLVSGALPLVGHLPAFMSDTVSVLERGYAEHGQLFRLELAGTSMVVVLDPEHRKELLLQPETALSISAAYPFLRSMFGTGFYFMAEEEEYRRQRELFMPVFHGGPLRTYLGVMERRTRELIAQLGDEGELELVRTCGELNLRVIVDCFFGEEFGPLFADDLELFETFSGNVSFLLPPGLHPVRTWRSRVARRHLQRLTLRCLAQRRAHPLPAPDFLQSLTESRYRDGTPVPDSASVHQALGLVWAAGETTAGQLAWALADLLRRPEHHPALLAEQHRHLSPDAPLTVENLHRLTRMDHVLYESERLNPLAVLIARKTVRDTVVGGHRLRRGTFVLTSPYLVHRMPDEFPDPHAFRPERYVEDPKAAQRLFGFGSGIHRCLGRRFSRLEIKTCLTLLLRHYEMELIDVPRPVARLAPRAVTAPCRIRFRRRPEAASGGRPGQPRTGS